MRTTASEIDSGLDSAERSTSSAGTVLGEAVVDGFGDPVDGSEKSGVAIGGWYSTEEGVAEETVWGWRLRG